MRTSRKTASSSTASRRVGLRSCRASKACWNPAPRSSSHSMRCSLRTLKRFIAHEHRTIQANYVYTIYIAATPEAVWQALTSAEFSRKYFFGNSVEVDLKVGGAYVARPPHGSVHISGEVVECDPPRKLTVTFNVNWPALIEKLGPTLVSYEIE